MAAAKRISRKVLFELFDVDLKTGRLFWKKPPTNHPRLLGQEAGCEQKSSTGKVYWIIKIQRRHYRRSHLIFLAVHGKYPKPMVDHKNGDSLNDVPENLRQATGIQNAWNHKTRKRKIKLPMGVRFTKAGRYQARISHYGKQIHLGAYDTVKEASCIYRQKRQELYGEFA